MSAMSDLHIDLHAAVQAFAAASVRHGRACGYTDGAGYAMESLTALLEEAIEQLPASLQRVYLADLARWAANRDSDAHKRERLSAPAGLTD